MANKNDKGSGEGIQGLIEGMQDNERAALDSVKRFVDTVNDSFPDVAEDTRAKIIDAAFKMTEDIVDASNRLAITLVGTAESTLRGLARRAESEGE